MDAKQRIESARQLASSIESPADLELYLETHRHAGRALARLAADLDATPAELDEPGDRWDGLS